MSIFGGPNIPTNGLIMFWDAGNPKSLPNYYFSSLINTLYWITGSGGTTGYNQNGSTAENARVFGTNPWGQPEIVWESRPLNDYPSGDGGWNTDWFTIDPTKLYRFSVWVKRTTVSDSGTFYFGMYANGDGPRRNDNNVVETNPYWHCGNGLTQNQWYLFVGHVYPHNTTYTGQHPESGYYIPNNPTKQGSINSCNIGAEIKWSANSNTAIHRAYHFYAQDNTTKYHWFHPRVDLIDGTEPTIFQLVNEPKWFDLCGNYHGTFACSPWKSNENLGALITRAAGGRVFNSSINLSTTNHTIIGVSRYATSSGGRIISSYANNWLLGQWSNYVNPHYAEGWVNNGTIANDQKWRMYTSVGNVSSDNWKYYINNSLIANNANGSQGPNGIQIGGTNGTSELTDGRCGLVMAYNRVLSEQEIIKIYYEVGGRYGL